MCVCVCVRAHISASPLLLSWPLIFTIGRPKDEEEGEREHTNARDFVRCVGERRGGVHDQNQKREKVGRGEAGVSSG